MQELPGQRLFQYTDGSDVHPIDSTQVNEWLKEKSGIDGASAKYFRTWHASRLTLSHLLSLKHSEKKTARIRQETLVLKHTSAILGHRPPVCKKHYIHPEILTRHREGSLLEIFPVKSKPIHGLNTEEQTLIHFLRKI